MHLILKHSIVLAVCAISLIAAPAAADVGPPDLCPTEGAVCDNAGPSGTLPGICTASTCSSPEPKPDGGIIQRDCLRCMPSSGGNGGAGGRAGAGGSAGISGAGGSSGDDNGCSCRLSSAAAEGTVAASMLLLGLAAFRGWRRQR